MASLIFSLLARLPLGPLQAVGVVAGWLTYALSPTYRRRLRANQIMQGGHLRERSRRNRDHRG